MIAFDAEAEDYAALWEPYYQVYGGTWHTVTGDVRVLRGVTAYGLMPRDLLVYLPPSYHDSGDRRYPVLYLHDGQNVFDAATSYAGEWGADETAETLAARGLETILVAIPNAGNTRVSEYSPWVVRQRSMSRQSRANIFLQFMLNVVRPQVDSAFRTSRLRTETGIAGSSLGGLISLYACLTHPGTFGFCGAVSPAFWPGRGAINGYAREHQDPGLRIYLDVGHEEAGERFVDEIRHMRDMLAWQGYDVAYVEDPMGRHNEESWRQRFPAMLAWFLDPARRPEHE